MVDALLVASGVLLAVSSLALFAYGVNMLYLSWRAFRLPRPLSPAWRGRQEGDERQPLMSDPTLPSPPSGEERLPLVCVQLPIYNERYVAERVIDAACGLDWPRERLEVQVLDDSDDDTSEIAARAVRRWRARGVRVDHVRRGIRAGYKAGALARGLELTAAPFVAILDADFVPAPDFLRSMMPAFVDERVGFAHARWGHLNERYSPLTFLQALAVDFHFLVEQPARCARGFFTNFTGTAGVWRRRAIEESGGWSSACLTEDLDLSYRAQLLGWLPAYLEGVVVPEELPVGVDAYRRQQARWATGSFQAAFRHLPRLLRSGFPPAVKWQAAVHLLSYAVGPLMLVQLLCYPEVLYARALHQPIFALAGFGLLVNLASAVPWAGFAVAQLRRGRPWWAGLPACLCQMIGAGLSLTVLTAFVRALRPGGEFKRTPKFHIVGAGQAWRDSTYVLVGDRLALAELALALVAIAIAVAGAVEQVWLIAVYAALFGLGALALGVGSVVQALEVLRPRLAGVLATAGLLVLPALLLFGVAQIPDGFEDSYHHWLIAARLAQTGSLHDPLFGMEDTWLPGYHLLAAGLLKLFGLRQLGLLKAASALLALTTLALVARLAPTRRAGRLAVLLCGLNPIFWMTATATVAEPLLTVLLLGATAAAAAARTRLAAVLAVLACVTGTKAWLWLLAAALVFVGERALTARAPRPTLRWALPALAAVALLQLAFGPATHSVARAAVEVASATQRGSIPVAASERALDFGGWFLLASLPLAALAPAGLLLELRNADGRRRLTLLYLPAALYLGAVLVLVWAGVYTGSHRYYYLALPALALLAGVALDRYRAPLALLATAAAALVAVAYVPVALSFSRGDEGLAAAGRASGRVEGNLLTDSPVAAYWSGKAPIAIVGSRELPSDPDAAVVWLRGRGVTSVVVEDISYYRATTVFPELVTGRGRAPFLFLGDERGYQAPGGKRAYAYALDPNEYRALLFGDVAVCAHPDPVLGAGKTASLQKGLELEVGGRTALGEGMGFGVPAVHYADGWHFAGSAETVDLSTADHVMFRKTFDLDRVERDDAGGRFLAFDPASSRGRVQVTYTVTAQTIEVQVLPLDLMPGFDQVVILNEQSGAFDDFADASKTLVGAGFGPWVEAQGSWARLRSQSLGVEWSQPALAGAQLRGGREVQRPRLDWAGLDYDFGAGFTGTAYAIQVSKAR